MKRVFSRAICTFIAMVMVLCAFPGIAASADADVRYTDVPAGAWYTDAVLFCSKYGYMSGTSKTTFDPGTPVSRAMAVTIIWRLAGAPSYAASQIDTGFSDVPSDMWYSKAISWAKKHSVAAGIGGGRFAPNDSVTREQLAVLFRNFVEKYLKRDVSQSTSLSAFKDAPTSNTWSSAALKWAYAVRLINGKGNGILDPKGYATRAELAQIVKKLKELIPVMKTEMKLIVNGTEISQGNLMVFQDDIDLEKYVMIPFTAVLKALGHKVHWGSDQVATVTLNGEKYTLTLDRRNITLIKDGDDYDCFIGSLGITALSLLDREILTGNSVFADVLSELEISMTIQIDYDNLTVEITG